MSVRVIVTGGTFEKQYDALKGELTFKDSHLPRILELVRCTAPVVLEVNQLIDSLHMQAADRERVLAACAQAPESRLLVIHGTDTLVETAHTLGEAGLGKTVVLTGAMVPYSVAGSDALFNLGYALAMAQSLPPGVYVTMNARTFPWDNVRKNREQGVFEALDQQPG